MTTTALLVILLAGAFLIVPWPEFRRLTPLALASGPPLGLVIFTLAGPALRLWWFHDRAILLGLPVMLILAWYPVEILFAYTFKLFPRWYQRFSLVLLTALGTMLTYNYLWATGVWENAIPWHTGSIFLLSAAIHTTLAIYLWRHRDVERRSSIPPLR